MSARGHKVPHWPGKGRLAAIYDWRRRAGASFAGRIFMARLKKPTRTDRRYVGRLATKPGHHLVLAETKVGELPRWQVFKLHVTDPVSEGQAGGKDAAKGARQRQLEMSRPDARNTTAMSERSSSSNIFRPGRTPVLCVSGWMAIRPGRFPYWGNHPPAIDLTNLSKLATGPQQIMTPQNVPFLRFSREEEHRIHFLVG